MPELCRRTCACCSNIWGVVSCGRVVGVARRDGAVCAVS
jgi:hypothetical protein